ncbi:B12-binding domain-containing radical SAM protein [Methylomarinum vadi]|uniref:B12-binding domain-containing radical SAM protein n=1 Tax=Methylomarinum vadi TaxID=438855 RepID=UPI0004DF635C|nr:DUF4070 domain-containing protein [Methylomarinum vadi]
MLGLYNHLKPYYRKIELVDLNVDPRPLPQLITDAGHVYMGGMSAQQQSYYRNAVSIKQCGKTLIVGGTAVTGQSPLMDVADHLIENEAEMVIDDLLQGLATGTARKYYRGTPAPADKFFQPDYSAIDLSNYAHMALQISRGCPESCEFCDIPARFGKNYRVTPWRQTRAAFRQLSELGWRGPVFIVDDNFIGNPKSALEALKKLYHIGEELGIHHPKYTEMTLRFADESETMHQVRAWFRRCNFSQSFYGVETPNKAALRETDKRQNLRGERNLTEKLTYISEQTGSGVMMGMIFGFDHDSDETVERFIDFVNSSHAPIVMAGLLNALPQTALMRRLVDEGRFIQNSSGNNSDGVINFIPWRMSVRLAERNYLKILEGIYCPKAYFRRVMRHLGMVDPGLKGDFRGKGEQLLAVGKILTRNHAPIYWRYLPQAVAIAGRRFSPGSADFQGVLAEFFALCAQYTHFIGQTRALQREIAQRQYQDWQLFSWQQFLQADITSVELLQAHPMTPVLDTIRVRLQPIDFSYQASRLQIMRVFCQPFLERGFAEFQGATLSSEQCLTLQIQAFSEAFRQRSALSAQIAWPVWERYLKEFLVQDPEFPGRVRQAWRKYRAIRQLADAG